jgi:ribosomal protein S19E (S16A)
MPATNTLDFSSAQAADKALKKVSQLMIRAGQAVAGYEFNDKKRRVSGVTYREATLTLASGQVVVLRVNATGDIFQVTLNGNAVPLKNQTDSAAAVAEIAALAERNQAAFQKAQARKQIELPRGMRTTKPKQSQVYAERLAQLDTQIADRAATVADLQQQLGAMTDSMEPQAKAPAELNDAAKDVLRALAEMGPLDDGDIPSKAGRDDLIELGWVDRYTDEGANVLNAAGKAAAALLDSIDGGQVADVPEQPAELVVAAAYVAARDIVTADPVMLDSLATAGAVEQLRQALAVVENNAPINESEGNLDQAALERNLALSFKTAIAMLDSADTGLSDAGLAELVSIAVISAADAEEIKDQAALAQLLALGLVETTEGLYMLTNAGRSALEDAGYDPYGVPFAAQD